MYLMYEKWKKLMQKSGHYNSIYSCPNILWGKKHNISL